MQNQLSENNTSYSPLFFAGLSFESNETSIDPPENQGGGTAPNTSTPTTPEEEEESSSN